MKNRVHSSKTSTTTVHQPSRDPLHQSMGVSTIPHPSKGQGSGDLPATYLTYSGPPRSDPKTIGSQVHDRHYTSVRTGTQRLVRQTVFVHLTNPPSSDSHIVSGHPQPKSVSETLGPLYKSTPVPLIRHPESDPSRRRESILLLLTVDTLHIVRV